MIRSESRHRVRDLETLLGANSKASRLIVAWLLTTLTELILLAWLGSPGLFHFELHYKFPEFHVPPVLASLVPIFTVLLTMVFRAILKRKRTIVVSESIFLCMRLIQLTSVLLYPTGTILARYGRSYHGMTVVNILLLKLGSVVVVMFAFIPVGCSSACTDDESPPAVCWCFISPFLAVLFACHPLLALCAISGFASENNPMTVFYFGVGYFESEKSGSKTSDVNDQNL
eukprot:c11907_g1_i1.p1 GENE.c11907_g1_i1~~c11907_g1_i1.p1  ORF type:complete len:229 (-),score=18.13 c11907_g1_i1:417-1103(-)